MKTLNTFLLVLLFTSIVNAQKSFYEQLKENGIEATYTQFFKDEGSPGIYNPGKQGDDIKIKPMGFARMTVGFEVSTIGADKYLFGANESSNSGSRDHYPITKMVRLKDNNIACAMIDGSLFKFKVGNDGVLKPENLLEVFVLNGKKSANVSAEIPEKKKKKGFFKQLKNMGKPKKTQKNRTQEKNYLQGLDIKSLVNDFEAKMSAKQKSYQLTAKEKVVRAKLEDLQNDKKAFIKRYNDSIYYSPEQVENRKKWARINAGTKLTVKNNKSSTVWVSSSESNHINTKIGAGKTGSADCRSDLYYFFSDKKGAKGYKFYTADSACGASATIN